MPSIRPPAEAHAVAGGAPLRRPATAVRLLVGLLGLLLVAAIAQAGRAAPAAAVGRGAERLATGEFDVQLTPADPAAPAGIGGMSMAKTFRGDLAGTGTGRMLAVTTAVDGSAGYVAMERVSGTLAGRRGSFALQHSGTLDRGAQALSVTVVPDSADGELAGLTGRMAIRIEGGRHFYSFRYALPR